MADGSTQHHAGKLLKFHLVGEWSPGQIDVSWRDNSQKVPSELGPTIEATWQRVLATGVHLFDGAMCRLESFARDGERLLLSMSRTSYRIFLGTNISHPQWADQYGIEAMANPVGVSSALVSADGVLMMGKRNGSVAYYPWRVHPFAGALEPREPLDVFSEVRRELNEELGFGEGDVARMTCVAPVEGYALRQPELLFITHSTRTRGEIERQVDRKEHDSAWAVIPRKEAADAALLQRELLTPMALAAVMVWGKTVFGERWFEEWRTRFE